MFYNYGFKVQKFAKNLTISQFDPEISFSAMLIVKFSLLTYIITISFKLLDAFARNDEGLKIKCIVQI